MKNKISFLDVIVILEEKINAMYRVTYSCLDLDLGVSIFFETTNTIIEEITNG